MIAVDYQQGLLSRLNHLVKGTKMESQSVTDTVISTASQKEYALAFNYSSQALNNSFFLECLKPPPPPPETNEDVLLTDGHIELISKIRMEFGDLSQLKSTFSAAAMGMINSGWVWLVCDETGEMEVVATFGAGTLLVRSRQHLRTAEMPILGEPLESTYRGQLAARPKASPNHEAYRTISASSPTSGLSTPSVDPPPPPHSRSMRNYAKDVPGIYNTGALTPSSQATTQATTKSGVILTPLLCCSVYEHAWVGTGYGVWGKEEYLKRFWTVVNWDRVNRSYNIAVRKS